MEEKQAEKVFLFTRMCVRVFCFLFFVFCFFFFKKRLLTRSIPISFQGNQGRIVISTQNEFVLFFSRF